MNWGFAANGPGVTLRNGPGLTLWCQSSQSSWSALGLWLCHIFCHRHASWNPISHDCSWLVFCVASLLWRSLFCGLDLFSGSLLRTPCVGSAGPHVNLWLVEPASDTPVGVGECAPRCPPKGAPSRPLLSCRQGLGGWGVPCEHWWSRPLSSLWAVAWCASSSWIWGAFGKQGGGAFLRNWTPCRGLLPPPLFLNAPWGGLKGVFGCSGRGSVLQGKKCLCTVFL